MGAEGVLNCLKPPGLTSHDLVKLIRRLSGVKRVGHAGTLDPEAAGVLLVCLGRATRLSEYLMSQPKEYLAEVSFGIQTGTDDAWGPPVKKNLADISRQQVKEVLQDFVGEIVQVPPRVSAIKHRGRPLYRWVREGEEVKPSARTVTISEITLLGWTPLPPRALIRVNCSQGTYVRSLCRDLGLALGTFAHMSFLLRTQVGPYRVSDSWTVEELTYHQDAQGRLPTIPSGEALTWIPEVKITDSEVQRRIGHGQPPPASLPPGDYLPGTLVRLTDERGRLMALARTGSGREPMALEKVFSEGEESEGI